MSTRLFDRANARWVFLVLLCACGGVPLHLSMKDNSFERPSFHRSESRMLNVRALPLASRGVQVIGRLALVPAGEAGANDVELPDVDVSLRNASTGLVVAIAKTELNGKFRLAATTTGSFRVCWSAGGLGTGCGQTFSASPGTYLIGEVPVVARPGVVRGKVLTGDGRPCWITDAFFHLDVSTKVRLLDGGGVDVQPPVRANWQGEYAFGGLAPGKLYTVRADCEKSSSQAAVLTTSGTVQKDLTFANHAPRLGGVAAFDSAGLGITRAPVSATITVNAQASDAELDPIEYLWRANDATVLAGGNSPQQQWALGPNAGQQTVYLMARDGRGGYAFKRFDIPSGVTDLTFSGRAIDETTKSPVAGATVSVNGKATTTDSRGWFRVAVPPVPQPERYVLNLHHSQYALLSRIHDKASVGQTYELTRAQVTSHDPTKAVDLVDSSSGGPCGGQGTQTGGQTDCRHRGAHIIIPAGAIVDSKGNPASGPVQVSMTTLNPARRAIPGDYRAVDKLKTPTELLSFGALNVELRTTTGQPLNLRSGTTAEIRVPVSDLQQPSAPALIPIWSYDEASGLWVEEGSATLQNTAEGWMYVGTTPHFSTLNMDVAGNDPAQATCVRLELGASLAGWTNLVLRAYVSYAGTSVQVKETPLDGAQYHAIYRIPYSPPAAGPNTLRLELRGTYNGTTVVLLNNIINTDARPKMTGTNLWPPYPYTECGDPIVLEADPVNLPYYGDIDATGRPAFLTGPYGQFNPPTGEQDATDYYDTIDPGNATNPTLSVWWTNHGFNADGTGGDASAQYLNFNDLGFGRDMNCKQTGSDLACYVTNYGLPDQNLANADAAEAHDATKRGATVAMEYIAALPADQRVRFYVYSPGDPALAGKLKFADLDGLGPKPVPHLCHVCHGGSYDSGSHLALNARFREFDLPSFRYSSAREYDFSGPNNNSLTNTELTNFTTLNKLVRDIAPAASPIQNLIDAWYTTGYVGAKKPVLPTPPAGWSTQVNGYHNVYAKSCRTCHVARDAPFDFTFSDSNDFSFTDYAVCGSPKFMPNAFVTYKNFWSDTQRVIDYQNLTGAATCQ